MSSFKGLYRKIKRKSTGALNEHVGNTHMAPKKNEKDVSTIII